MRIVPRIRSLVKVTQILPALAICLLLGCGEAKRPAEAKTASRSSFAMAEQAQVQGVAVEAAKAAPAKQVDQAGPAAEPNAKPPVVRKIISTSRIELITDHFTEDSNRIEGLITALKLPETGGFVSQREINGSTGSPRHGLWTVRLDLEKVDGFLNEASTVAQLIKAESGSNDVTDQYVDLSARVKNKQQEEARLLSHLEKSVSLTDTLLLEKELSRVREEVERLQGQLNVLTSATDLATVHIRLQERSLHQPPQTVTIAPIPFVTAVSEAFMTSYLNLLGFLRVCTIILAALSPWLAATFVVVAPCWLIAKYARRRTRTGTA